MMRWLYYFLSFFFLCSAAGLGILFCLLHNGALDLSVLEQCDPGSPSILLDDEGKVWGTFELDRREAVPLHELPKHLIDAFIAAEDHAFFTHKGLSLSGIVRSLLINCYYGGIVQGASTITQQLVKLLFTDSSRTFKRKIKEQLLALLVERQFSKEHILQIYLNQVYFGAGVYGVEAASQRFWAKSARNLTLSEAATLAAIVKNPGHYCPLWYPLSAQRRRNYILRSMAKLDFITSAESAKAQSELVTVVVQTKDHYAPHAKEAIRAYVESLLGRHALYHGGLQIATTLNSSTQKAAQAAFEQHVKKLRETLHPRVDGGLLSMDVATGHIKALVGGFDFSSSQYNRALQARRQLGSIFKTVVFAAALEHGFTFAHTAIDEPLHIEQPTGVWSPRNYTNRFEHDSRTLAWALSNSNNIIAIKTILAIGPHEVVKMAERFHLPAGLEPYPSLALGCVDCTVKEAAALFNVFANNGCYTEPSLICWIKDRWGAKVFKHVPVAQHIIDPLIAGQITKVLSIGMNRAFARSGGKWLGGEAIGKTGTTNDSRTCWFAGSTPELTTVIYIGNDDNSSLGKNIFAVKTAFPIWQLLYKDLLPKKKLFTYDPRLRLVTIDSRSGALLANAQDPKALSIFLPS